MTTYRFRQPTGDDLELGARIRNLRECKGLSQDDVGRHMHKTASSVAHWETGYSRIAAVELPRLALLLCCPVAAFFGESMRRPFGDDVQLNDAFNRQPAHIKKAIRLLLLDNNMT